MDRFKDPKEGAKVFPGVEEWKETTSGEELSNIARKLNLVKSQNLDRTQRKIIQIVQPALAAL